MELAAYELACFELKSDQDHPLPAGADSADGMGIRATGAESGQSVF